MLIRSRRGQSAVLIALVLFTMLLLVAMSTNIGIVVNDKIRMQSTADLSTYAAAYSEAASLNELVERNREIVDAVHECRQALEAAPFPETTPCGCMPESQIGDGIIEMCKLRIDTAISRFLQRAQYSQTVGRALEAGEATAGRNFPGVSFDFFSRMPGSPTMSGTYWVRGGLNMGGGTLMFPSIADIRQVTDTAVNYSVIMTCPVGPECIPVVPFPPSRPEYLKTWFYKENRDPEIWVAGRVSGTPEKQYLDTAYGNGSDGGYFGASSTGGDDEIYAYSVAKPYDGSIGPTGVSGYQQDGNMLKPNGVYWSRGTTYPKMSMNDEYRARLAGINENLAGTVGPDDLVMMDGYMNGKTWDMGSFKH